MANTTEPRKLVRFDWFIKKMLRSKADFEILEGFLSELLKENVEILEIVESESNKKDQTDKFNRVDVLVKTADDERVIIEIQNTKELDFLQRIFYGASATLVENIKEGFAYKEIKRVISISVIYYNLGIGRDYVYYGETTFRGFHDPTDILGLSQEQLDFFANPKIKRVEDIFARYYLIRAKDFSGEIHDGLDEWIYFFKNGEVRGNVRAKGLEKAKERLRVSSLEGDELAAYKEYLKLLSSDASYEAQMKFEIEQAVTEAVTEAVAEALTEAEVKAKKAQAEAAAKAAAKAQAKAEAKAELEKEQMILEMESEGFTVNQIAKITKKTEAEVQQIIAKYKA